MNRLLKIVKNNNKNIFFIVFLVTLFSSTSVLAQKSNIESASDEISMSDNSNTVDNTATKVSTSVSTSNVNFILWFMGTKEDINKTFSDDMYSRKSILTSGREPNHLLMKTLLKKAINIKSC